MKKYRSLFLVSVLLMILYLSTAAVSAETTYTWKRVSTNKTTKAGYSGYDFYINDQSGAVELYTKVYEYSADGSQNSMEFFFDCQIPPETIKAGDTVTLNVSKRANIIRHGKTNWPLSNCEVSIGDPGLGTEESYYGNNLRTADYTGSFSEGYPGYSDGDYVVSGTMPSRTTAGEEVSIYFTGTAGVVEWRYRLEVSGSGSSDGSSPANNTDYVVKGKLVYAVKNNKATFFYRKNENLTKITVPATIKYKGKKIPVTGIAWESFKGMKKLKTVVIGRNVKKIEKNAFRNCPKLKNITIKTTKLTSKRVEANAFKGINKKAIVKCPKAKKALYKKIFLKRGMKKTVKFRNL